MRIKEMVLAGLTSEEYVNGQCFSSRVLWGGNFGRVFAVDHPSLRYIFGRYEPEVAFAMRELVHKGDTVFDIGAHVGYHTLHLSRLVGKDGKVYSFEPDPRTMRMLGYNIRRNKLENIRPCPQALTDTTQKLPFVLDNPSYGSHLLHRYEPGAQTEMAETTTIDRVVYSAGMRPPSFIKIDAEGEEVNILKGAQITLDEHRPAIVAEVKDKNMGAVGDIMKAANYHWEVLSKKRQSRSEIRNSQYTVFPE